jgi:hypothetical protein
MARIRQNPTDFIEMTSDFSAPRSPWRAQYRPLAKRHASSQSGDDAQWIARADYVKGLADAARTFGSR